MSKVPGLWCDEDCGLPPFEKREGWGTHIRVVRNTHPSKSAKGGAPTFGLCGMSKVHGLWCGEDCGLPPFEKREGWGTHIPGCAERRRVPARLGLNSPWLFSFLRARLARFALRPTLLPAARIRRQGRAI